MSLSARVDHARDCAQLYDDTNDEPWHPDPEIDAGVRADVAEAADIDDAVAREQKAGWFYCACGASHDRGPLNGVDVYRCLRCGTTTKCKRYGALVVTPSHSERTPGDGT